MFSVGLADDLPEIQCVSTRGYIHLEHLYNQHNQNNIVILPGELLFAFQSPQHENVIKDTLILRSLPSLNTLLRQIGPAIGPEEIMTSFLFLGSCLSDWGVDNDVPWIRGIDIIHAGCMKVANLFDDVTKARPGLPRTLPRHAYLWLRPCVIDRETLCVVPYNARAVEGGMQHRQAKEEEEKAAARKRQAGAPGTAERSPDEDGAMHMHEIFVAEPEDEETMLAQLEDWADPADAQQRRPADAVAEEKKRPAPLPAQAKTQAQAQAQSPLEHEYFWQWVPVCSTHPDLQDSARSVRIRDSDVGQQWLLEYPFLIYVGQMIDWPSRVKPRPLESEIMQFATYGPLESHSRAHYDRIMCDERHTLQRVEIDTQLY